MKIKATPFDASKYLDSEEAISAYINATLEEGDVDLFMAALAKYRIRIAQSQYLFIPGFNYL